MYRRHFILNRLGLLFRYNCCLYTAKGKHSKTQDNCVPVDSMNIRIVTCIIDKDRLIKPLRHCSQSTYHAYFCKALRIQRKDNHFFTNILFSSTKHVGILTKKLHIRAKLKPIISAVEHFESMTSFQSKPFERLYFSRSNKKPFLF